MKFRITISYDLDLPKYKKPEMVQALIAGGFLFYIGQFLEKFCKDWKYHSSAVEKISELGEEKKE